MFKNILKNNISLSVIAENIIKLKNIDISLLQKIKGTGPQKLVMKSDILEFLM